MPLGLSIFPDEIDKQKILDSIEYFRSKETTILNKMIEQECNYDYLESDSNQVLRKFEPPEQHKYCQLCNKRFEDMSLHIKKESHLRNFANQVACIQQIDQLINEMAPDDDSIHNTMPPLIHDLYGHNTQEIQDIQEIQEI